MNETRTLGAIADQSETASLEDLARLRRESRGEPDGSSETTDLDLARINVLDVARATREQLLPDARSMAAEHPHEPVYAAEVARLRKSVQQDECRALVLGASLSQVGDATGLGRLEAYALRQELVGQGLLLPAAIHLA